MLGLMFAVLLGSESAYAGHGESADRFRADMLETHNAERAVQSLQPFSWDEQLSKDAMAWAKTLARTNRFEHAFSEVQSKEQGENLWMGTKRYFSFTHMVGSWLSEKKLTQSGVFPKVSVTGNWAEVGHYTQIIWPKTRKLGCALASNEKSDFLVCRYWPAGNRVGTRFTVKKK